ncbi:MAG: hypothetical protein Q7U76_00910, partial [Nitrospirota bacterium]|nr:hypothetical protein [Nitrospirota bacterium]
EPRLPAGLRQQRQRQQATVTICSPRPAGQMDDEPRLSPNSQSIEEVSGLRQDDDLSAEHDRATSALLTDRHGAT